MVASNSDPSLQLTAAQVLLAAGQTKEALQCTHQGATLEHIAFSLQIYLKIDRLDLAEKQLGLLRSKDEDAILTQLCNVFVHIAKGKTGASDAIHGLNSLTEQYGASSMLLNLTACALLQQGNAAAAEEKLNECIRDFSEVPIPDTLINMIVCLAQQNKPASEYVAKMQQQYPAHPFCSNFERVSGAFDREAIKYKV